MNPLNPQRPNSMRMPGFNYKVSGFYFITICSHQRHCIFSSIEELQSIPSSIGKIIEECWQSLPEWFPSLFTDYFIVMPNHVHAIIQLSSSDEQSIPTVIASFKSAVSRRVHESELLHHGQRIWQRGYFDHIIRSEHSLMTLRQYILDNPVKWHLDELNPESASARTVNRSQLISAPNIAD